MASPSLTWALVDQVAEELGVSEAARRKWRSSSRRVPWEWRVKIADALTARNLAVQLGDFDRLESAPGRIAA